MKDLDFDELDKAINTVLSDKEMAEKTVPNLEPQNDQEPPRLPGANRVQGRPPAASQPAKPPLHRPFARPPVTPASRRGVIDIIAPPSKMPSRQAAQLQPVTDVRPPQPNVKQPLAETPIASSAALTESSLRWPAKANAEPTAEPIDHQVLSNTSDSPVPPPAPAATVREPASSSAAAGQGQDFEHFNVAAHPSVNLGGDKVESAESPVHIANQAPAEPPVESGAPETPPPTSPFLSDAKVEKRPLGAFSGPSMAEPAGTPVAPMPENKPEPASTPQASSTPTPPPAESLTEPPQLHPSLTSAEAEQAEHTASGVKLDHLLDDGRGLQSNASAPAPALGVAPSIPQQYITPDTPNDDTPRPVFDTSEYHAPMPDHPAAKHNNIGLWIAFGVIVALAIAGGFIIYFFGDQLGL